MENLRENLTPIQRLGISLQRRVQEKITDVDDSGADVVTTEFTRLLKHKAVQEIILATEPINEEGAYLVFAPSLSPEKSLLWVRGDYGAHWHEDVPFSRDEFTAWSSPHFEIWPNGEVFAYVDNVGDISYV